MPTPFPPGKTIKELGIDTTPHRVPALRSLRKWIKKNVSDKPCKDFRTGCFVCESWLSLQRLEQLYEDEPPKGHSV